VQLPGRLIAQRNKVQIFRVAILESGVTKKTHRERKLEDSVGVRRAWCSGSAIIPEGGLPNAMALIVRRCQPSGPSKSPKIYRTVAVYRGRETPRRLAR
jgi:hypothetical protein